MEILVLILILVVGFGLHYLLTGNVGKKEVKCCVFLGNVTELHSNTKTKTGSAVGRGLVGGALMGPVGVVAGAGTAKKKTVTKEVDKGERKFLVEYTDGTKAEETAFVGTERYKYLMSKVNIH